MRLINTESLELESFLGDDIPEYAILSHTWEDGEAKANKIDYILFDTNCIDKSSSAELSESINSMFAWYRESAICYVYLADVEDPDNVAGNLGDDSHETGELEWDDDIERRTPVEIMQIYSFKYSLRNSKWFTRGWTLQELLAPRSIRMFTKCWKPISAESQESKRWYYFENGWGFNAWYKGGVGQEGLLRLLSDITGIRVEFIGSPENVMFCSNGERMSWIAGRETTREEDIAYCMLGIFDINMPLLYGEGSKAFTRLQEEIIKQSTDKSLFAWQWPQDAVDVITRKPHLFADSNKLFSNFDTKFWCCYSALSVVFDEDNDPLGNVMSLTNFGLSITLN